MNHCLHFNHPLPGEVGVPAVVEHLSIFDCPHGIEQKHEGIAAIEECVERQGEDVAVVSFKILLEALDNEFVRLRIVADCPHVEVHIIVEKFYRRRFGGGVPLLEFGLNKTVNSLGRFPGLFIKAAVDDDLLVS